MRFKAITDVLCLSCALFFLYVKSQAGCPVGWFGIHCNYKCRCLNEECNYTGQCILNSKCADGWFGPECQFADLASRTHNEPAVVDGDDSTCIAKPTTPNLAIQLEKAVYFQWLRVIVSDQGEATLEDLSMTFSINTTAVTCPIVRKQLQDTALDMHCNIAQKIDRIVLDGVSASYICSVYVSGGRNVALKEWTFQDTTKSEVRDSVIVSFTSDKAVDGNTNQSLYSTGYPCSHTDYHIKSNFPIPHWILKLSHPREVTRYVIYNRWGARGSGIQLVWFRLESFDSNNQTQYVYQDNSKNQYFRTYQLIHPPLTIESVVMTINNSYQTLALCEVEVYGDSICDYEHYGRDCEQACVCPNYEACFVSTGGCPLGCPAGFYGTSCLSKCRHGKYGKSCKSLCSQNCEPPEQGSPCNHETGYCPVGCKPGYYGGRCEHECNLGYYGANCSFLCNHNCKHSKMFITSTCNHRTGACTMGCNSGFSGDSCDTECGVGKFGENCIYSCSQSCVGSRNSNISTCNHTTGACFMGCTSGFSGENCDKTCDVGMFGSNCSLTCSKTCASPGDANISLCNHDTGNCIKGCKPGFTGPFCDNGDVASYNDPVQVIVGLCLVTAAAMFFCYCFRKLKETRPEEEMRRVIRTANESQPDKTDAQLSSGCSAVD